jgi:hypothetical protein
MPFTKFKGGKLPPVRKGPALGDFLDKATMWPAVPAQGWEYAVPASALDILGNDQYGDCAEAAALHLIQAQSYNVGRPVNPTLQDALNLYSAVTGFNPNDPATDQGTVLTDLLAYWQNTGITIGSTLHQIEGFAQLDITSMAQLRWAAYTFGGDLLGLNLPGACEQNLANWNYGPGQPTAGGHCVPQLGEGADGGKVDSWKIIIPVSVPFLASYLDEACIVVTKDWLNAQNESPSGLDLNGLLAAMKTAPAV